MEDEVCATCTVVGERTGSLAVMLASVQTSISCCFGSHLFGVVLVSHDCGCCQVEVVEEVRAQKASIGISIASGQRQAAHRPDPHHTTISITPPTSKDFLTSTTAHRRRAPPSHSRWRHDPTARPTRSHVDLSSLRVCTFPTNESSACSLLTSCGT